MLLFTFDYWRQYTMGCEDVFKSLREVGCCKRCCLRVIGERESTAYSDVPETLRKKGLESPVETNECGEDNVSEVICIACLGLLQDNLFEGITEKISNKILEGSFDSTTFTCALSLPVCFQIRAHSLWLFIRDKFPEYFDSDFARYETHMVPVKDVWKWTVVPAIAKRVNKSFDSGDKCNFFVNVNVEYANDEDECAHMQKMCKKFFAERRTQRRKFRGELYTRKGVEQLLPTIDSKVFKENFPCPPSVPQVPVAITSVACSHNSIYFAGRYNKFSRFLSQTPWLIDGERRMESSVQEIISDKLEAITQSEGSRFSSSGREDVDVRMLGRGRPFSVELLNPHRTCFSRDEVCALQADINMGSPDSVIVRDLQLVTRECLAELKKGEQEKQKLYEALCICHDVPLLQEKLDCLSSAAPLQLQQWTPIRVLHRRPLAERVRTIHSLAAKEVSGQPGLFKLEVMAQAGTYIKEFVHGDFGRTTPDLGQLLGGVQVDILALDVLDIMVDWPPQINS
ncbi:tRNA pseudouridine synthase Pus10 [Schistocerca americana]|uniref:tRNA pseudouridine synthase Pus10 n=1 Tax=Schistocerca americana TaxID=7009 RepID=UPI001F50012E|nr:tRNA pseudouridine synthase Pus10 [Schistocerca americana]XP_047112546.1 tRNA pseudouridine synthase Pus10 [Schistocerca piceifrons]